MGTENESPEPDCQKQFQAAVSVIQNLPKNGEGTGARVLGVKTLRSASQEVLISEVFADKSLPGLPWESPLPPAPVQLPRVDPSTTLPSARVVLPPPPSSWSWG